MDLKLLYRKHGVKEISVDQYYAAEDRYSSPFGFSALNSSALYSPHAQVVNSLTVKIEQDKFLLLLEKAEKCEELNKRYYEDMYVRDSNPTVKAAYEKYRMFLELARSEVKNDRLN
jgi:hypothetical protein